MASSECRSGRMRSSGRGERNPDADYVCDEDLVGAIADEMLVAGGAATAAPRCWWLAVRTEERSE